MIVRNPRIAFADALPHWAPNRSFAQITNAGSTSLPAVETFLNAVMARIGEASGDPRLRGDIALFTGQEGNHYRQHRLFNRLLYPRYPHLRELEARLQADHAAMLARWPLRALAAYCEGFESLGLIYAEFFFEQADDLVAAADVRLVTLWRWHLAEEYEHRRVCSDALRAVGGGYGARLRGFAAAARHLGRYGKTVSAYLLAVDRATMSAAERAASIAEERAYRRRFNRFALPRLLAILSPGYDPAAKRAPRGSAELLAAIAPAPAAVAT